MPEQSEPQRTARAESQARAEPLRHHFVPHNASDNPPTKSLRLVWPAKYSREASIAKLRKTRQARSASSRGKYQIDIPAFLSMRLPSSAQSTTPAPIEQKPRRQRQSRERAPMPSPAGNTRTVQRDDKYFSRIARDCAQQ